MSETTKRTIEYLVTGAGGQLGSELCRQLGDRCLGIDINDLDITDRDNVRRMLSETHPRVLINTAAYTAVDKAEEQADRCRRVNSEAVQVLAEESSAIEATLVQISTDYVFGTPPNPRQPHSETAETCARGVYAKTKLEAESHVAANPRHFIVRTCGLYGQAGPTSAGNFVTTMMRLGRARDSIGVVNDQHCTPTWVHELAQAIVFLSAINPSADRYGTYHIVNKGETTWYEMAKEIFRLASIECEVNAISTEEFGAIAPRPLYSVLNTDKYHQLGGPPMSPWNEALEKYVDEVLSTEKLTNNVI